MRSLKFPLFLVACVGLGAAGAVGAGCGAGAGDDGLDGSGGADGNTDNSSANGFTDGAGAGSTGSGPQCTDPSCIGGGQQGNCDQTLAIDSSDAMDGARAIGLCQVASGSSWGVVSAEWVRSDGQPLVGGDGGLFGDGTDLPSGKGILDHFGGGISPREGSKLLGLSSGTARNPTDPGYADVGSDWKDSNPHGAPAGYPKESPSCPGVTTGEPYDSAGLRLVVKTPTDAKSLAFDFDFYTYEFPTYICSPYNDFFVAMMSPTPAGLPDGNISFDSQGNTISVNAGFLQVCTAQNAGGKDFPCALGPNELSGTGFESHAATSWLTTTAPIESPGSEITLHFAIWDSGDGVLDSTTLIDNFRFDVDENSVGTTPIPQ